jgi:hypothetical protein
MATDPGPPNAWPTGADAPVEHAIGRPTLERETRSERRFAAAMPFLLFLVPPAAATVLVALSNAVVATPRDVS